MDFLHRLDAIFVAFAGAFRLVAGMVMGLILAACAQQPGLSTNDRGGSALDAKPGERWGSNSADAAVTMAHAASAAVRYPPAFPLAMHHTYHGVTVTDEFEWLENASDPATQTWIHAQNAFSRRYLDDIQARAGVREQMKAFLESASVSYSHLIERAGIIFALKNAPPKQQPLLVALSSVDDLGAERVVFDPNEAAADGSLTIDFFEPSPDGKWVAISVSEGGSEDGSLRIFDLASGRMLADRIARVTYPTGGGSVAWSAGGTGIFYTRYPSPGSRPDADLPFYQQVYFHRMGTSPDRDRAEVGADFPRIAETDLKSSRDGHIITALVANGDGGDYALYLKLANTQGDGEWRRIADEADGIKAVEIGDDNNLYLLSRAGTPHGKVLRLSAAAAMGTLDWSRVPVVAAPSDGAIEHYVVAGKMLYLSELVGGPSRLRRVDLRSGRDQLIQTPPISGVTNLVKIGSADVLVNISTYLTPSYWAHVAATRTLRRSALVATSLATFNDSELVREMAISQDGTVVPMSVIRRKGTRLDGRNPTILYGYGGYGVSLKPRFMPASRVWLDRGGIFVIANLRGGGEFGEEWHRAGNLTRKQNVFDDFFACAEHLIKRGYTRSKQLGIMGGSNGGLLMGAALTQRPELFRAVDSAVGIYDMLRVERDPNGAFNTTEFGTVEDKAQFEALYAYSPLHRVRDGVAYPAVLMIAGDNDGRVNPAHSRKMVARLQAANPHGRAILLRTSASSGHGMGTALSEHIEQMTDEYAFFINELMESP